MLTKEWDIDGTWTLFLDRDGVINERNMDGYITSPESFIFLKGAREAISQLSNRFNRVLVVTNQQGVGKGLMTERNVLEIHTYMCDQVHILGGRIDKCYFAPNLKDAEDDLRKPGPQMAEMAKMEFPEIEYKHSIMVGDTDSDILFGKNIGMKTVRIRTEEPINVSADLTVNSLEEFLKRLDHEVEP
ncbi:MAG: D-glycero-D-manno-heptose 1,7-bisphosphate phosphatase [Crocinitomicaceae bacterium]|jgi:D-glycero-D-manno-heptose 1,7-bisphosphate phosphatase